MEGSYCQEETQGGHRVASTEPTQAYQKNLISVHEQGPSDLMRLFLNNDTLKTKPSTHEPESRQ